MFPVPPYLNAQRVAHVPLAGCTGGSAAEVVGVAGGAVAVCDEEDVAVRAVDVCAGVVVVVANTLVDVCCAQEVVVVVVVVNDGVDVFVDVSSAMVADVDAEEGVGVSDVGAQAVVACVVVVVVGAGAAAAVVVVVVVDNNQEADVERSNRSTVSYVGATAKGMR